MYNSTYIITGKTYHYRTELKEDGARWDAKRKAWIIVGSIDKWVWIRRGCRVKVLKGNVRDELLNG